MDPHAFFDHCLQVWQCLGLTKFGRFGQLAVLGRLVNLGSESCICLWGFEQMIKRSSQCNSSCVGASATALPLVIDRHKPAGRRIQTQTNLHGHGTIAMDILHCEVLRVFLVFLKEAGQHVSSVRRAALSGFDLPISNLSTWSVVGNAANMQMSER